MPKILHLDIFLMNMKYKKEHPCLQTLVVEQTAQTLYYFISAIRALVVNLPSARPAVVTGHLRFISKQDGMQSCAVV